MSLKIYHQKRDFKKTSEPRGKTPSKRKSKKLFIIQKHAASHLHYDFRLELDGVLKSWAVPKGPCLDPIVKRLAMHVEDHPLEYGSFQGIIPKGEYGGGTVMLWDKGEWISIDENAQEAYQKGSMTFELHAKKLNGLWKLIRINNNNKTWLLIKIKDEYAKSLKRYDITIEEPNSVLTNQTMEEIAQNSVDVWSKDGLEKHRKQKKAAIKKKPIILKKINLKSSSFPKKILPELATLVDEPPIGKKWLHEIKLDGYRILALKEKNKTRLLTRKGNNWTNKFKHIADEINALPISNVIFDGEVVVLDETQHSDFQALQNVLKQNKQDSLIYYVFDIIYYDKYNLTSLPLLERKKILQKIITSSDASIRYNDHLFGSGEKIFKKSCELGLEGIISKDSSSPYIQKRTRNWLKIKCIKRQEFIIGGYNKSEKRSTFSSLLLGTFNKRHELIYNGKVGTGFTESSLKSIIELLNKYKTAEMPFNKRPPDSKNVVWVKPILISEIEFIEWTEDGYLRHPSFKGLRNDKNPSNVTREMEIPVENITHFTQKKSLNSFKLTNPNKILYPEQKITKQNLANYYDSVQQWILPYITDRPLTLLRCPEGYHKCFFQKHLEAAKPSSLYGVMIKEKKDKEEYLYLKDHAGLLALAQLAVLEIHPWGSKVDDVEFPDTIVFDLDPAPDVKWEKIVAAAFLLKKNLAEFKLKSFVKTTGGKGLHVVIPIKPEYDWDEVKNFSHVFVDFIVMQNPQAYTSKMTKSTRVGKIFIDYLRNQRGATFIAPYSTRAREDAPVATPIDWDELTKNMSDTFFTLKTLPNRLTKLKRDPWHDYFKIKQSLRLDTFKK